MKFNKTSVFLTLFGLFLLVCLAMSVKSKFHEAMTTMEEPSDLAKMPEEGGVFDPDAHVDAKYRDRPKKASLSFMEPLERLNPEGMQNQFTDNLTSLKGDRSGGKFGFCPGPAGAPKKENKKGTNCHGFCPNDPKMYKLDASGSNCYGFCPDNASIYKTDASGTNCYGYCVANNTKSPYKTDASGSNCFGFCPNDATLYKMDELGSNCFGKCENKPDVWKIDASGSNCSFMCSTETGAAPSLLPCCSDGSMRKDKDGTNCPPKMQNQSLERGLCPDGKTFIPPNGMRCPDPEPVGFGLCSDGVTYKTDSVGSNCSKYPADLPQSCKTSPYGCCPDMKTPRDKTGSNCFQEDPASVEPGDMYPGLMPYNTTTVFIPPPAGVPSEQKKNKCTPEPAPKKQACASVEPECPAVPKGWAVPGAGDKTTLAPVQVTCPAPPPCPACARCPEPAFECKKVPNYNRADKDNLPQAVLPNFSSFGM